jgi:putative inorganic carbon (HCO3(-)) transporter
MSITNTSYLIKAIDKIDLSNQESVNSHLKQSLFYRFLKMPLETIHKFSLALSDTSLVAKYIDQLIMANLIALLIAITFAPTIVHGLLVASGLLLTVFKWFFTREGGHNFTLFDIPVAVYIAVALISVAFSSYFMPSLKGLAKLMTYFASYVVFANIFKGSSKKLYLLLIVIAITGGLEAIYGILQRFQGVEALATWQDPEAIMAERKMTRVYGSLVPFNPNLLAGYLLPVAPVVLGMGLIAWLKKKWYWALPFFAFSLASLVCIVFTGSRGAYIGLVLMVGFIYLAAGHIFWHEFKNHRYQRLFKFAWITAGLLGILGVIFMLASMPALQDRIMSIFTIRGNSSNSFRMNVYLSCWEMFKDNWLIGIGPGNSTFRLVYGFYMETGFDALGAYSVPLEIAVEMGIIGLLASGWLLLVIFSNGVKAYNASESLEVKLLIMTLFAAFIAIGGQAIFDTIWYRPQVHIIFWLLVAALSCIVSRKVYFKSNGDDQKS